MQLIGFLGGRFDEIDVKTVFAEDVCNAYCLDKVTNLGLRIDGSTNTKFQFTYKPVDSHFEQGDILHNFEEKYELGKTIWSKEVSVIGIFDKNIAPYVFNLSKMD